MATEIDIRIVQLLKSDQRRAVNEGGELFEEEFKSRSISFLKKAFRGAPYEDIWQEAAANMVVNIQEEKYTPQKGVKMYSYFYYLLKSAAIKEYEKSERIERREEFFDTEIESSDELDPQEIYELIEFRMAFEACLAAHKEPYLTLLRNIYSLGLRLIDFYKKLGIDTYNNAKVKHHTAKKKLLDCLKFKLKDGK